MSEPIPLLAPDGKVHAYACGTCGFVHAMSPDGSFWNHADVQWTRSEAEACCVCEKCGAVAAATSDWMGMRECPSCLDAAAKREQ